MLDQVEIGIVRAAVLWIFNNWPMIIAISFSILPICLAVTEMSLFVSNIVKTRMILDVLSCSVRLVLLC